MYRSQTRPYIFQPGKFTGRGSEGVKIRVLVNLLFDWIQYVNQLSIYPSLSNQDCWARWGGGGGVTGRAGEWGGGGYAVCFW